MKPETSERLVEMVDRLNDEESWPAISPSEAEEISKGLHELLDERRGAEAEELRAGLEALMADAPGGDIESNNEWNAALQKLLDEVDARDSLAHLELRELTKERRREALLSVLKNPRHVGLSPAWRDELIERSLLAIEDL